MKSKFNRLRLPSPADYFKSQGLNITGAGGWKSAVCPFHDDTKPSLRVRLDSGCFCCMVCGKKGGDVLAFHRLKNELSFVDACKALGAWEECR
jgi:DNA primase